MCNLQRGSLPCRYKTFHRRNLAIFDPKRSGARGFHEGIFDDGFGSFATYKKRNMLFNSNGQRVMKRRPEMDSKGIHGDAFTGDA